MPRILIFANGELPDLRKAASLIKPGDLVVCADGGSHYALALGLTPSMIIGDLDSISEPDKTAIQAARVPVQKHPHDKNETDLELALQYALEQRPSRVVIAGALGRRLDHSMGNLAMLASSTLTGLDVRLDDGLEEAFFCRGAATIEGRAGEIVSLIPWGASVEGVSTEGLKWPLRAETLYPDKTRGISNELLDSKASVSITSGLLLVIHRRQTQAEIQNTELERTS